MSPVPRYPVAKPPAKAAKPKKTPTVTVSHSQLKSPSGYAEPIGTAAPKLTKKEAAALAKNPPKQTRFPRILWPVNPLDQIRNTSVRVDGIVNIVAPSLKGDA